MQQGLHESSMDLRLYEKEGDELTTFLSFTESNEQVGVETMGPDIEFEVANFCRIMSKS